MNRNVMNVDSNGYDGWCTCLQDPDSGAIFLCVSTQGLDVHAYYRLANGVIYLQKGTHWYDVACDTGCYVTSPDTEWLYWLGQLIHTHVTHPKHVVLCVGARVWYAYVHVGMYQTHHVRTISFRPLPVLFEAVVRDTMVR